MITVNGVNLRDLGFVASGRPQLPRLGGERTHVQPIPGRLGGVRMGGQVEGDTITVQGHVSAPDHVTLLERLDMLAGVLQGRSVIRLSDYPDREWVGYLQQGPSRASAIGPAWITRAENVVLQWSLPDPTAHGSGEIVQVPGALALGTAPSPLRVAVQNGGVAPITRVVVEAFPNEIRNADLEASVPGYAPYWDPAPSRNLLGPDAGVEIVATGSERYLYVGRVKRLIGVPTAEHAEPLAWRGLQGGDVVSWAAEIRVEGATTNSRLRATFFDAAGATVGAVDATPSVSSEDWASSVAASVQVPATAVTWLLWTTYSTGAAGSTRHFRRVMLNLGDPIPYEAPSSVVYDPEGAYSGSRYLEMHASAGGSLVMLQRQGERLPARRFPVEPGDVVTGGVWTYRVSGSAECGVRIPIYRADGSVVGNRQGLTHSPGAWGHAASVPYTIPADGASVAIGPIIATPADPTTARFSAVYLRIRRGGKPQRILQWDGVIAPGAAWECGTADNPFAILNGGANAIDGLTADSEFPVAEPGAGGYGYVQVTITGGGGHTSTVRYRRRWL